MAADLVLKAGPFFGINAQPEVVRLQKEMARKGCPHVRAHVQGQWIILEGWREIPDDPGPLPSKAFVDALIHDEVTNWGKPQ